jgi:Transglycosylase-like domain
LAESSLLSALLANESGGRNINNTTQGTSSGQAQGYFQITTGTWDEFGGPATGYSNPQAAPYNVQAAIASKIPLARWDSSTLARMRATGYGINPKATLGENLASNGESFSDFNPGTREFAAAKGAPAKGAPIEVAAATPAQTPQTAAPPNVGSMIGQALGSMATPSKGGGGNNAALAQAAPLAPGPQMAFKAAADDAAQASNLTAGGSPGSGAAAQPGAGPGGMTGLLGLMADPTAQTPIQGPTDVPMTGMSGLLYSGGAGLGVRRPAVTRLT